MQKILLSFYGKFIQDKWDITCSDFYHVTLYVSTIFAVARYLTFCPSIWHVGVLYPDGWR